MLKKQKGAVLLLTAIMLPVLLAFMGLAVDFANVFAAQTRLQSAADASALAGAQVYFEQSSKEKADDMSRTILKKNYPKDRDLKGISFKPDLYIGESKDKTEKYYYTKLQEDVPLYFMPLVHLDTVQIRARATALIPDKTQNNLKAVLVDNNKVTDSEDSK